MMISYPCQFLNGSFLFLKVMLLFSHLSDICSAIGIFAHFAGALCFSIVGFAIFELILIACLEAFNDAEGIAHWTAELMLGPVILMLFILVLL